MSHRNLESEDMGSSIDNLREEFLRILSDIEAISQDYNNASTPKYKPSKYESCVKIKGQPIIPPLMTDEKRQECFRLKIEAIEVENRIALKRRAKYLKSIQTLTDQDNVGISKIATVPGPPPAMFESGYEGRNLKSPSIDNDVRISQSSEAEFPPEEPVTNVPDSNEIEEKSKRERRLSYTLEEPSPVLLAYMQRFGNVDQIKPNDINDAVTKCDNPRCYLEDYLSNLAQAPKIISIRHTPVESLEEDSPGKENVPPIGDNISSQQKPKELPMETPTPTLSPLKPNEGPSWAKSPRMTSEKEAKVVDTTITPTKSLPEPDEDDASNEAAKNSVEKQAELNEPTTVEPAISVEIVNDMDLTPRSEATTFTVDSSLMESVSLPTMKEKPRLKTTRREQIEAAVTALAIQQQKEIQKMIEQQSKEREQLRQMFEDQQRELINSVLSAVSTTNQTEDSSAGIMADLESNLTSINTEPPTSSIITPTSKNIIRIPSPVIPTVRPPPPDPSTLILPTNWNLPEEAQTPENSIRFEKLSALVKGHLTRRLMRTQKVQDIIKSMKDLLTIALQLHREAQQYPKMEDVQLHARLLQQLQRESQVNIIEYMIRKKN